MKLAISNIAWEPAEDDAMAELLRAHDVSAVEIAPTKYWLAPCTPSAVAIAEVRSRWADRGLAIVALQSLLFGCPQLTIFGDPPARRQTADYLARIIDIAHGLGARALVFGSPKNRDRRDRSMATAVAEATEFFRPLAERAHQARCTIAFEPNPAAYSCNFCTTVAEALQLIEAVDHPGLLLNLDVGIMYINSEPMPETIEHARPSIAHVHISEPNLAPIGTSIVPHDVAGQALAAADWQGYVSIEMRSQGSSELNAQAVGHAIEVARRHYLKGSDGN